MAAPERTCVVCRKKAIKNTMVRFVMSADGQLVADNLHRLPGRGAYRHASCMTKQVEAKIMYSLKKASIKKQKLRR